jgi:hypothetical protein
VHLNDNQITLDLEDERSGRATVAVFVMSLDDVAIEDNQIDCNATEPLFASTVALALRSVRVEGNDFKESLTATFFSGLIWSFFMNSTVNNQATHCLLAVSATNRVPPNAVASNLSLTTDCNIWLELAAGTSKTFIGGR